MKLNYDEAEKYLHREDVYSDYGVDETNDFEDLSRLREILNKYNVNIDIVSAYDQIFVAEFPEDGIEEEDLAKINRLGFFLEEDSFAKFC